MVHSTILLWVVNYDFETNTKDELIEEVHKNNPNLRSIGALSASKL